MSLWFYEETTPFAFSLADELTEVKAELIRRCGPDCGPPSGAWSEDAPDCDVVDLAAVRAARSDH